MQPALKIVKGRDLPAEWKKEMGVDDESVIELRVKSMEEAPDDQKLTAEQVRLLALVDGITPVKIEMNSTEFLRAERDRIDGRNENKE